ncbi:T9SS type A sorting domain-containing protein [Kordia sp.]|uniref:T9SS type A sorting domain-containing protein n=1 Tax=Kordia sp. TaxID=1965332 RepID=UPI003D2999C6
MIDKNSSPSSWAISIGFGSPFDPIPAYTNGSLVVDGVEDTDSDCEFMVHIDNSTLSINDINTNEIELYVYPNPATNSIQFTSLKQEENYTIFDISGRKIRAGIVSENKAINIQQLRKGIYFVQLKKQVLQFIKK